MSSRIYGPAVCLVLAALAPSGCQKPGAPQAPSGLPTITTQDGGELVRIPAGFFEMGSRYGREEEKTVHTVWIDSFLMDRHEVTQAEYEKHGKIEAFPNPSHFQGADLPVEQVTWPQASRYCNARGNTPAGPERIPTTHSAAKRGSSATSPGSPTTPSRRLIPSAGRSPIRGASLTCTATWPSGARMSTTRDITRLARRRTRADRPSATKTSSAAAHGNPPPMPCDRPTRSARPRASPTLAWPAMPLASAACASRRPRRMQDESRQ